MVYTLRRLSESLILFGSVMWCRTIVIFGTLKDGSLQINSFSILKQLFQLQKHLQKWRQRFTKNGANKPGSLSKSSKFRVVWTIRLCSNFTSMWYKRFVLFCFCFCFVFLFCFVFCVCLFVFVFVLFLRNVWRDFRLPMPALATVARKSF